MDSLTDYDLLADVLGLGLDSDSDSVSVAKPNNVIDVASKSGKFSTFLRLIRGFGLTEELEKMSQVTIFAPTDDFFISLNKFTVFEKDLKRHLIAVKLPESSIETGPAFTLSGQVINLIKNEAGIQIAYNDKLINVSEGMEASNGIVYAVDNLID